MYKKGNMFEDEELLDYRPENNRIGLGHSITALYEVELKDTTAEDIGTIRLKWNSSGKETTTELTEPIRLKRPVAKEEDEYQLMTAVVLYIKKLREGYRTGDETIDKVIGILKNISLRFRETNPDYSDFAEMVYRTKMIRNDGRTENTSSDSADTNTVYDNEYIVTELGGSKSVSVIAGQSGSGIVGVGRVGLSGKGSRSEIQNVIDMNAPAVNACYQKHLKKGLKPRAGKISVQIKINKIGRVAGVTIVNNTIHADMATCVLNKIRGWKFPRAESMVTADVGFVFVE